ncbi:MAG: hypothetical protein IPO92_11835 [Saprospiraceae bacterium]|nr:hypothetical protein [Saprospiraceae bacterium]
MRFKVNIQSEKMKFSKQPYFLLPIYVITVLWMSISFGQKDFVGLFPCYSLVFGAYLLIIFKTKISLKYQILLGILVRISLIPVFPNLSVDIYRFFWDGSLTVNGINPYGILPSEIVGQNIPGLTNEIFLKLNSKEYFTIYPPLSQLYYSISALTENLCTQLWQ